MDEASVVAALQHHWEYAGKNEDIAHEIYHDDAVLEMPQAQERFVGKANILGMRSAYPAGVVLKIRSLRGRGDFWVAKNSITYDGGQWNLTVSILEFRDDKVARETIYITQSWEAPEWRAP